MKIIHLRTKLEAILVVILILGITITQISANIVITPNGLTTTDSTFRVDSAGNWLRCNNMSLSYPIFDGRITDPSPLVDGMIWYNTTADSFYQRAGGVTYNDSAIYACLSDSTDQTFAATGEGYNITFNTNDGINGITHSTVSEPQNITIVTSGVYTIIAQPQVHAGAGASGYFHMWLRKDSGGGFADVANTNVELTLASNEEDVIPLILTLSFNAGDVIRINASVGHTGIELDAQTPAKEPAIPSIIFSMYRIGS